MSMHKKRLAKRLDELVARHGRVCIKCKRVLGPREPAIVDRKQVKRIVKDVAKNGDDGGAVPVLCLECKRGSYEA